MRDLEWLFIGLAMIGVIAFWTLVILGITSLVNRMIDGWCP